MKERRASSDDVGSHEEADEFAEKTTMPLALPASAPSIVPLQPDRAFAKDVAEELASDAGDALSLTRRIKRESSRREDAEGIPFDEFAKEEGSELSEPPELCANAESAVHGSRRT